MKLGTRRGFVELALSARLRGRGRRFKIGALLGGSTLLIEFPYLSQGEAMEFIFGEVAEYLAVHIFASWYCQSKLSGKKGCMLGTLAEATGLAESVG